MELEKTPISQSNTEQREQEQEDYFARFQDTLQSYSNQKHGTGTEIAR